MTEEDVSKLTYEQAIIELEKVVETLESGSAALEKSIELYSLGDLLKKHCLAKLRDAEEKVSVIVESKSSENFEVKPFFDS
tara:strand:+ start:321 stop:563 length:243 start_codon:yes stop_codon:yes gene_type:complete